MRAFTQPGNDPHPPAFVVATGGRASAACRSVFQAARSNLTRHRRSGGSSCQGLGVAGGEIAERRVELVGGGGLGGEPAHSRLGAGVGAQHDGAVLGLPLELVAAALRSGDLDDRRADLLYASNWRRPATARP